MSMSPRKIEMIAGGASLAPSRWSLPAVAIDARSRSACSVHGADHGEQEDQELHVGVRVVAGIEQVDAGVGGHRPVVVLAAAVDAGKRLLVQQSCRPCRSATRLRVSITSIWWSLAMLAFSKSGAISYCPGATSLCRVLTGTPSRRFPLGLGHEGQHARGNGAEVVVLELLALGRPGAEERPVGVDQVGARSRSLVDQEVLLLGPSRGVDAVTPASVPKS